MKYKKVLDDIYIFFVREWESKSRNAKHFV